MTVQEEARASMVRGRVRAMWAGVAAQWEHYADDGEARVAPVTERLLERAALRPDDRVLELACGAGGLGLEVAGRLGPGGEVVMSDVVEEMVDIARRRTDAAELPHVRTAVLDLEAIDQPDAGYDVVLCREGLMFAVDPGAAVCEMARVTRAGGRMAVSVWASAAENPWLGLALDAVGAQLGHPVPPPGIPGPFSLGDPARLRALFQHAGLDGIVVEEVPCPLRAPSFEAWWTRTSTIGGPLVAVIAGLGDDVRADLIGRLRTAVAPYSGPDGIELPGLVLVVSARRAP